MTRTEIFSELQRISGNRYFLADLRDNPAGIPINQYDIAQLDARKFKAFLKQVKYDVTDKGIWIFC